MAKSIGWHSKSSGDRTQLHPHIDLPTRCTEVVSLHRLKDRDTNLGAISKFGKAQPSGLARAAEALEAARAVDEREVHGARQRRFRPAAEGALEGAARHARQIADSVIESAEHLDATFDDAQQALDTLFQSTYSAIRAGREEAAAAAPTAPAATPAAAPAAAGPQ